MPDDLDWLPLFPSESQIARAVMGDRYRDWPSKAQFYEDTDPTFPRINQLMGGRYWPAVKLWFDHQNGVAAAADSHAFGAHEPRVRLGVFEPDGKEDFGAALGPQRRRKTR